MRILIVDDDDQLRKTLMLMLGTAGYEVLDAANGKIALSLQQTTPADLVITDIIMPEMEGIEFITKIRNITPATKIIAMSGDGKFDPDIFLEIAAKLGADRTLLKPFSKSVIMPLIAELLSDSNLRR